MGKRTRPELPKGPPPERRDFTPEDIDQAIGRLRPTERDRVLFDVLTDLMRRDIDGRTTYRFEGAPAVREVRTLLALLRRKLFPEEA
jgi:hypothetical protein